MVEVELLEGARKNYAWGSPTAIPDLLGLAGSGEPIAELWLGAHPSDPARVGAEGRPLDAVIADDPVAALGSDVAGRFGGLPYLFKVIAAGEPLSLQAHPTIDQAAAGYDRENAAGIALDAPERFFRDRNHKPELICALSRFEALCGFREPGESLDLLTTIDTAALEPVREMISAAPDADGVRDAVTWLLTLGSDEAASLVASVRAACQVPATGYERERALAIDLATRHPHDAGVVTALLLNIVTLDPDEALFLAPGTLHCYLSGTGVELMANSDNVVRGGLTVKPIDVAALLDVVDTSPLTPAIQAPPAVDGVARYESAAPEFSLARFDVAGSTAIETIGPATLLCVAGVVEAGRHTLDRGAAAWVPASDPPLSLSGAGTVFQAGVGELALQ